jgi:hypothetical protein
MLKTFNEKQSGRGEKTRLSGFDSDNFRGFAGVVRD